MVFVELTILFVTILCVYCYLSYRKSLKHFEKIGIPYIKPIWPLGSDWKAFTMRDHGGISRWFHISEPFSEKLCDTFFIHLGELNWHAFLMSETNKLIELVLCLQRLSICDFTKRWHHIKSSGSTRALNRS